MFKNGLRILIHACTKQNMLATPYVEDPWNNCTIHTAGTGKMYWWFYLHQAITKTTWPAKVYTLFKGIPSTLFSMCNADFDNLLWMYWRYKL